VVGVYRRFLDNAMNEVVVVHPDPAVDLLHTEAWLHIHRNPVLDLREVRDGVIVAEDELHNPVEVDLEWENELARHRHNDLAVEKCRPGCHQPLVEVGLAVEHLLDPAVAAIVHRDLAEGNGRHEEEADGHIHP
jgi:hypothetical protein